MHDAKAAPQGQHAFSPLTGAPSDRAKQFIPFAALRGFYEMVEQTSRSTVPRRELMPDRQEELDAAFSELIPGDVIGVQHYKNGEYTETIGRLEKVDRTSRTLTLGGVTLHSQEIAEIELIKPTGSDE